jgi:hypothetical protein
VGTRHPNSPIVRPTKWMRTYPVPTMAPNSYRLAVPLLNLLLAALTVGLPVVVFQVAGGDGNRDVDSWFTQLAHHQGLHMHPPLAAGAITFLSLVLVGSVVEVVTRLDELRTARRWYARVHPDMVAAGGPAAQATSGGPETRKTLEELVRLRGPLNANDMHRMLTAGGEWGPAVQISKQEMFKLLTAPDGRSPVEWSAPRTPGKPYNHRANVV